MNGEKKSIVRIVAIISVLLLLLAGAIGEFNYKLDKNTGTGSTQFAIVQSDMIKQNVYEFAVKILFTFVFLIGYIIWNNDKNAQKLAEEHAYQESINQSIPGGIQKRLADEYFTIVYANKGFFNLTGYSKEEVELQFQNKFLNMIHWQDIERVKTEVNLQLSEGSVIRLEYRIRHKMSDYIWVADNCCLTEEPNGSYSFIGVLLNINSKKIARENLRLSEERYRIVSELSESVIFEYNMEKDTFTCSNNFKNIYGIDIVTTEFPQFYIEKGIIFKDDIPVITNLANEMKQGVDTLDRELRMVNIDGEIIWNQIRIKMVKDKSGKPIKAIGNIVDIDKQKKEAELLNTKACSDDLTGVYNKMTAQRLIETCIINSEKTETHAIIIIDIDNFKRINDSLGHMFGDEVLARIPKRIKKLFRTTDIVGRIGGDEFIVLMKNVEGEDVITNKAQEVCNIFRDECKSGDRTCKITCSVGIAQYPRDGVIFSELYHKADVALYQTKDNGKDSYAIYDEKKDRKRFASIEILDSEGEIAKDED